MQRTSRFEALMLLVLGLGLALPGAQAQTVKFSGYSWRVKSGDKLGPGPNHWRAANVRVDARGWLHLAITHKSGQWQCAEVEMTQPLGFGKYQFQVIGRLDKLDRNIVLGLFNYPPPEIGPDGTNEIDIEFAHWGDPRSDPGNYTVWPAKAGIKQTSHTFVFALNGANTTQRFTWASDHILFQSQHGFRSDDKNEFGQWLFQPASPLDQIPQKPLPVLINLWLFQGKPPSDSKPLELVIQSFKYTPQ